MKNTLLMLLLTLFFSTNIHSFVENECNSKNIKCIDPYKKKVPYTYRWKHTGTFHDYDLYLEHYKYQDDDSIDEAIAFRNLFVLGWDDPEIGGLIEVNYAMTENDEDKITYAWVYGDRDSYGWAEEETLLKRKDEYECVKGLERIYFKDKSKIPSFMCAKTKPMGCSASVGNPCSIGSGNKFLRENDWESKTSPLQFYRVYNSLNSERNINDIGYGWSHNYDYQFKVVTYNNFISFALKRPDGSLVIEKLPSNQVFTTPKNINNSLSIYKAEHEWVVIDKNKNTKEFYSIVGDEYKITKIIKNGVTELSFTYNSDNRLTEIKDIFNRKIVLSYKKDLISSVLLPNGKSIKYKYDYIKRLISVLRPGYGERKYDYYETRGNTSYNLNILTSVIDENNKVFAEYTYDEHSRGIRTQRANNSQDYKLTYYDNYTEVVDPYNIKTIYNKTFEAGNPLALNSIKNGITDNLNTYDEMGNITQKIQKGVTTKYIYDLSRNLEILRTEAFGTPQERRIETTWHTDFPKPVEIKESSGGQILRTTTYTYDHYANISSKTITDPLTSEARTWSYEYNNFGQLTKEITPHGQITSYEYDSNNGNLIKSTQKDGVVTIYSRHNADGYPQHIESSNGQIIEIVYDDAGRILQQKQVIQQNSLSSNGNALSWWKILVNNIYQAFGASSPYAEENQTPIISENFTNRIAITSYEYDLRGLLVAISLPDGERIKYSYDNAHRLTEIQDQNGNRTVYNLNGNGDIIQTQVYGISGQIESKNQQIFDSFGRLQQILGNNQQIQTTNYNNYDQVQSEQNAVNESYKYAYDILGRQIKMTDPLGGNSQTEYDSFDQIKKVIDANNNATTYRYNAFGEKVEQNSPDTGTTKYQYQNGHLLKKIDALQLEHIYQYDSKGRIILQKDQKTANSDQYEYTEFIYGQSSENLGKLTTAKNKRSEINFKYNNSNLVRQKSIRYLTTNQSTAPELKVNYSYTLGGKLKQLALPSGNVINYNYNTAGQLSDILINNQSFINNIQYSANGIKTWTYSDVGDIAQFEYDLDNRIKRINMPNAFNKIYNFDSADRILSINDSTQNLFNSTFKHDPLNRLTEQTTAIKTFKYNYDINSNRLMRQIIQGPTTSTENYTIANNSNRLVNIQQNTNNKLYQYLATGQIISDGMRDYTYNSQGRSESISQLGGGSILNAYDAFGQRIQKFSNTLGTSSQTLFVYDENGQLLGEYTPNGNVIREYIWLKGILVGLRSYQYPNEILRVHTDHLGTPRAISNNQNNVVWRWEGDQFGDVIPTGTLIFPIRHAGQYHDSEVNIFYNYFRDYDPITGRYIESDPIGLDDGLNTYGYVGGNPLSAIDPKGQFAIAIPFLPEIVLAINTIGVGLLSTLPETSDNAPAVNKPLKKPGKYVCVCRAQGLNCDGERTYAFGTGIGNSLQQALSQAKKIAVSNLPEGFSNIHHTACKCTSPKGDLIIPH